MPMECGTPFIYKRMEDEETLELMVDGMSLRGVLLMLQRIAYAMLAGSDVERATKSLGRNAERLIKAKALRSR
jgi:hypothetical protein